MAIRARAARSAWFSMLCLGVIACSGSGPDLSPDPALEGFVGGWEAQEFRVVSRNDADAQVDLADGGSFTIDVEASGSYTAILQIPGTPPTVAVEQGRLEVDGSTIVLRPTSGPVATGTFHFEAADRLTLHARTEFDFDRDGEPDPADLHIVLQRR